MRKTQNKKVLVIQKNPSKDSYSSRLPLNSYFEQKLSGRLYAYGIMPNDIYCLYLNNNPRPNYLSGAKYDEKHKELINNLVKGDIGIIITLDDDSLRVATNGEITSSDKYRGSILSYNNVKIVPMISPQLLQKRPYLETYYDYDAEKVHRVLTEDTGEPEVEFVLCPNFDETVKILDMLSTKDTIAFDIEVFHEEVSCISFAHDKKYAVSISFMKEGKNFFTQEQEIYIWKRIAQILENSKTTKVLQNAGFDMTFLHNKYGIVTQGNVEDTMIAQAILYPKLPKGLGTIVSLYTDFIFHKDEGKKIIKSNSKEAHDKNFWLYNAKDSIVLMHAIEKQKDKLMKSGQYSVYKRQKALLKPILYICEHGIKADKSRISSEYIEVDSNINKLSKELYEITKKYLDKPLNSNSPKQLKEYFYSIRKLPEYKTKGKVSLDEKALKLITTKGYGEAKLILNIRKELKYRNTYLKMILDEDGRIRTSMSPVGTIFGRLSSSKNIFGRGGNIQNIPYRFKKNLLIDDGFIGYDIDLSQAENRIVAYISDEKNMINAFEMGVDIHSKTATYISNKPIGEISREKGSSKIDPSKSERDIGKIANHSLNYKMSARAFSIHWGLSIQAGTSIRNTYLQAYPNIPSLWSIIEHALRKSKSLTNLMGRKFIFRDRITSCLTDAISFIPQSTVADIINMRGLQFLFNKYEGVRLINQVHDSLVIQISKKLSPKEHLKILNEICTSLETPLHTSKHSFVIPAEVQVLPKNFYDGPELGRVTKESKLKLESIIEEYVKESC